MSPGKATVALLSGSCKVRILNYAAAKPIHAPEKPRGHACSLPAPVLNRTLLCLTRTSWLKSNAQPRAARTHSITPKGRPPSLSRARLKDLVEILRLEWPSSH